jgi:cellulose biosynthesis protein BcsQ
VKIITFASTKGGVGKSTTAVLVADSFFRAGQTVKLIDFDIQASVTNWAAPVCERNEGIDLIEFDLPHFGC